MAYRTKTYLAGDWTGDKDAIDKIHEWNNSEYRSRLDFIDVHDFAQAKDSSLPCTIKKSLRERMTMCKTFVLVVGKQTKYLKKGSCQFCYDNNKINYLYSSHCIHDHSIDTRSFVEYECEQAVKQELRIVVIYNACSMNKSLCPTILRDKGTHIPMKCVADNTQYWDYPTVRDALKEN